jgi:murein DD-endopeptidase MepM/ murein hydrolase activator NlpD
MLAVSLSTSVRADTSSQIAAERQHLSALQGDLDRLAQAYSDAETRLALTQARMDEVRAKMDKIRARMRTIQGALSARAREAYVSGAAGTVELLLSSASFTQFSDRVEYLGRLAVSDGDLLLEAKVNDEQLRRYQQDLAGLSADQASAIASLAMQKRAIGDKLSEAQSILADLQKKLADEEADRRRAAAASLGLPARGNGALRACPVGQPNTFIDSFGFPRPGGRTHQGIDMMAPLGTPVYAAQSGRFEQNYNSLGGTSALVFAGNGDYTYYAHLSSYAGVGNGSTVSAGTMIGHVGNSGDAQGGPYHLHFEYHPGGGGAIDPYTLLLAVC